MPDPNQLPDAHAGARHFCSLVREQLAPEKPQNVFVAGCRPEKKRCSLGRTRTFIGRRFSALAAPISPLWKSQHRRFPVCR